MSDIDYSQALADFQLLPERPLAGSKISAGELLSRHHPDYQSGQVTTLEMGINRGSSCHRALADLLQADGRIQAADLDDAEVFETDVLIMGGGGAGCAAALQAAEQGAKVMLATKLRLGDSNTVMAEGGIQVSLDETDSPQMHYDDTRQAGGDTVQAELAAAMVMDGPAVIDWLIQQGMQLDVDEQGDLHMRRAGGTSAARIVHFRDYTGLEMMRVLREAVFNREAVQVLDYCPAVELLTDPSGHCAGAVLFSLKEGRYRVVRANSTILATGGIGRMHLGGFSTSNHFGAVGDGLVLAYRIGAQLRDLDSFQYHPTGLAWPPHLAGKLVTEGVRAAGAWLVNGQGERFIDELRPRDEVAAAILRECAEGRGVATADTNPGHPRSGVWLDTPGLELRFPGIIEREFPKLIHLCSRMGQDPRQQPVLVYPTLHYQNGGVQIDLDGCSSVGRLYCVGELAGGIHGRNRLMGNALLDIISFGRRAGAHAASGANGAAPERASIDHLTAHRKALLKAGRRMDFKSPMLFPDYAKFNVQPLKQTRVSDDAL